MIAEKYRNMIAYWEGGGYDGCIWEPNMGFIDKDGGWHPSISTGCKAIDDEGTLLDAIEEMENSDCENRTKDGLWRRYDAFKLLPLTQDGVDALCSITRIDFVAKLLDDIADITHEGFMMKCTKCGRHFASLDYSYRDIVGIMAGSGFYRGCGGVATITDEIWCDECRSEGECRCCNEISTCFTDSDHNSFRQKFFANWLHICESCTWSVIRECNLGDLMDEYEEKYDEAKDESERIAIINRLRDELEPCVRGFRKFKYDYYNYGFEDRLETKGE